MDRQQVYQLVDGERTYQDSGEARPKSDAETSVGEWLIYIRWHLDSAFNHVYQLEETQALESIRKIAALAVACMEYNNTPTR